MKSEDYIHLPIFKVLLPKRTIYIIKLYIYNHIYILYISPLKIVSATPQKKNKAPLEHPLGVPDQRIVPK